MSQRVFCMMALVLGLGGVTSAQDPDEAATTERREIRVLRDPYDLASFYRAPGRPYFTYDVPQYGAYPAEGGFYSGLRARHPIASFYRQGGGAHYWRFWQGGYAARPPLGPGVYGPAYRETIGENGDLYLFAPFLAPMGPLAGAYHGSLARPGEVPRE
jgi:hypothetical protein